MNEARDSGAVRATVLWGGLLLIVIAAGFGLGDTAWRRDALRAVLGLLVLVELMLAVPQLFHHHRTTAEAAVGPTQDAGFYNLAMALLFALCAADPERNAVVLMAAVPLYAVHGGTHVLRYLGVYYGGEAPVPGRPRHLDLRAGLQLLVAFAALLAFSPPRGG